MMTPCQALSLALDSEKRAFEFFADVVDDCTDERVREVAAELAAEEEQHVSWVQEWIATV
jgi:rubrerythrin